MLRPLLVLFGVYIIYFLIMKWKIGISSSLSLSERKSFYPRPRHVTAEIFTNSQHSDVHSYNRSLMVRLIGGLGNQLWLYSSLYGLAKKTNRQPIACFKESDDIGKLFPNLSVPMYTYKQCDKLVNKNDSLSTNQRNSHLYYDVEMIDTLRTSTKSWASICCYLQNLGFFVEYFTELKEELVIENKYKTKAQNYLKEIIKQRLTGNKTTVKIENGFGLKNNQHNVFIAVHIRRGDMIKEKDIQVPGPSYFKKSMDYFREKYGKRVIFIVATNDLQWSKANVTGEDVYFTLDTGPKSRDEDFAIALACNHTIISVGTFGWWMGFLTGGDVVYFKDWVLHGWKDWYHHGQFYLQHWKPM